MMLRTKTAARVLENYEHRHELQCPVPTSMTLSAALHLLDSPLAATWMKDKCLALPGVPQCGGDGEEYVYLLPRWYLQNWLQWAFCQTVPAQEAPRVRLALTMAAHLYDLKPPVAPAARRHDSHAAAAIPRPSHSRSQSSASSASFAASTNVAQLHVDPGPIDASFLSVLGHPLLLRPHVVVGNGDADTYPATITTATSMGSSRRKTPHLPAANDSAITDLLAPIKLGRSLSYNNLSPSLQNSPTTTTTPQRKTPEKHSTEESRNNGGSRNHSVEESIGSVAVPERFYELLRSVHGVLCEDGVSLSFQPSFEKSVVLHHHVVHNLRSPDTFPPRPVEFCRRVLTLSSEIHSHNLQEAPRMIIEVYPIKFLYTLVDESCAYFPFILQTATSTTTTTSSSQQWQDKKEHSCLESGSSHLSSTTNNTRNGIATYPPNGFVLISRKSPALEALHAVSKSAAPDKSQSCVRLWFKMGPATLRQSSETHFATQSGDGFDLVDFLDDGRKTQHSQQQQHDKGSQQQQEEELTVAQWVKRQKSTGEEDQRHVEVLVEIRNNPQSPWPRYELEMENRIQVGDFVDAQDSTGKWYEAIVRAVEEHTVKVHYLGWSSRWDCYIRRRKGQSDISGCCKVAGPPAPLWSHTTRWRDEIKVGDEVEVREAQSLAQRPKWFRAIVRIIGRDDEPIREIVGGADVEALEEQHHNGQKRVLLLLNRTRQVLVEVPQEKFNSSSAILQQTAATQPPFLRWVNLYGEEICKAHTHLKPVTSSPEEQKPATLRFSHDPSRPPVEIMRSFNNIHGSGFVRESLKGVPPAPGSVGLHNLGNTCFLNSILQCLNHIEPLTNYFLKGPYRLDLNRNNPLGSGGRVALSYASLLNDMWSGEYSVLAPRLLKQTVASFAPQFNNLYQHDSQEFCSFLMDGLHEDLNRVKCKPYVEDFEGLGMEDSKVAMESWKNHLLRHDSIIVDHCQGMHRSHLTCPVCGKESVKFDVYSTISLPLAPEKDRLNIPLADCLEKFIAGEQLDEANAWYCPTCKKHVCALKMITLWSTPDILIFHLKRFQFNACKRRGGLVRSKIEDTVDFPVDRLDMSPYMLGPINPAAPPVYKLFGVSEHSGSTANSGHYTATVRNSRDEKWYRYNDSHVGRTTGDTAVSGGAYLLFYQRIKGVAKWAGMESLLLSLNETSKGEDKSGTTKVSSSPEEFIEVKSKKKKVKKIVTSPKGLKLP